MIKDRNTWRGHRHAGWGLWNRKSWKVVGYKVAQGTQSPTYPTATVFPLKKAERISIYTQLYVSQEQTSPCALFRSGQMIMGDLKNSIYWPPNIIKLRILHKYFKRTSSLFPLLCSLKSALFCFCSLCIWFLSQEDFSCPFPSQPLSICDHHRVQREKARKT